jgi:hypothetical protein
MLNGGVGVNIITNNRLKGKVFWDKTMWANRLHETQITSVFST